MKTKTKKDKDCNVRERTMVGNDAVGLVALVDDAQRGLQPAPAARRRLHAIADECRTARLQHCQATQNISKLIVTNTQIIQCH